MNAPTSPTGWAGTWGPMGDRRSKVARLAVRIERELLEEYAAETPLARRRVRQAARYIALSEATVDRIGSDPKATRRAAVAFQASADRQLAQLRELAGPRTDRIPTPAEIQAALRGGS